MVTILGKAIRIRPLTATQPISHIPGPLDSFRIAHIGKFKNLVSPLGWGRNLCRTDRNRVQLYF
jgi:hypothetical protein